MPEMSADAAPSASTTKLRQVLGPVDGAVIAMSNTAPTMSIGIGMGVIAGIVDGRTPAIVLLAFLPILGIASAYARLNRVERNLGNGYVWVGRALSPFLGFQVGWIQIVGSTLYLAYGSQVCGSMLLQFANQAHLRSVFGLALDPLSISLSTVLGVLVLLLVSYAAIRGADVAARFQTYLIVFEYAVLLGFCGYALFAGHHAFSLGWFNPFGFDSVSVLAAGLVVSVYIFWGWDSVFAVTEETRDPRDAARAGYSSLFLMLGMFLLAAVSFGRMFSVPEMTAHASQLLPYLGQRLASEPLAALPLLALLCSSVASLQAGVLPVARNALAMGRDQTLGRIWTRLHPRYATPAIGTLLVTGIAATLASLAIGIGTLNQVVAAAATSIGTLVSLYYALCGLACAVRFTDRLRAGVLPALRDVVIPALSAVVLLTLGGYLTYHNWTTSPSFALVATNGRFLASVPVAILVAGLCFSFWAKWGRRAAFFRGAIGETPAGLDPAEGPTAAPAQAG